MSRVQNMFFLSAAFRPQIHCLIRRSTSVIRMVFQHFGSVQPAHHVYLSIPSVASILSDFRTTLEWQILCTCLICFVHLIPEKKTSLPSVFFASVRSCFFFLFSLVVTASHFERPWTSCLSLFRREPRTDFAFLSLYGVSLWVWGSGVRVFFFFFWIGLLCCRCVFRCLVGLPCRCAIPGQSIESSLIPRPTLLHCRALHCM